MELISVIVPIYNVENYIEKCLNSIINQSYKNIEIILINDGSTDNSEAICKEFENKDPRIKLYSIPNSGVSFARNYGLSLSKGSYIGFVDPDDVIDKSMYNDMYIKMKLYKSDVCICGFKIIDQEDNIIGINNISKEIEVVNKEDIVSYLIPNILSTEELRVNQKTIMGSVCRLLIKKDIIDKKYLKFKENLPLNEDFLFCLELFFGSTNIILLNECYYSYRQVNNSAVRKYRENIDSLLDKLFLETIKIIEKNSMLKAYDSRLKNFYFRLAFWKILNESVAPKDLWKKISRLKAITNDGYLQEILTEKNTSKIPFYEKLLINLIKNNNVILVYLIIKLKITLDKWKV